MAYLCSLAEVEWRWWLLEHCCCDEAHLCARVLFLIYIALVVEVLVALHHHVGHWAGLFQSLALIYLTPSRREMRYAKYSRHSRGWLQLVIYSPLLITWLYQTVNQLSWASLITLWSYLLIWPTTETRADSRFLIWPLLTLKEHRWGKWGVFAC